MEKNDLWSFISNIFKPYDLYWLSWADSASAFCTSRSSRKALPACLIHSMQAMTLSSSKINHPDFARQLNQLLEICLSGSCSLCIRKTQTCSPPTYRLFLHVLQWFFVHFHTLSEIFTYLVSTTQSLVPKFTLCDFWDPLQSRIIDVIATGHNGPLSTGLALIQYLEGKDLLTKCSQNILPLKTLNFFSFFFF